MKKLFLMLAMILMIGTTAAYAEDISLDAMSSAELFELRAQIDDVIKARQDENNSVIHVGKYVCGKDIKVGMYDISCLHLSGQNVYLYVRIDHTDGRKYDHCNLWDGQTHTFELVEGDTLTIENGSGLLAPSVTSGAFWRP